MSNRTTTASHFPRRPQLTPLPRREPVRPNAGAEPRVFTESERRHAMIAEAAYFRAAARAFTPGNDVGDWLDAEREIDDRLFSGDLAP